LKNSSVIKKKNYAASKKSYFSIAAALLRCSAAAPETLNKIVKMKENINRNRTNFDGYKLSYLMISNYWFLGFVEGDGSFFLSINRAIFSITQKDRQVLEAISLYLYIQNIQRAPIFKGLFVFILIYFCVCLCFCSCSWLTPAAAALAQKQEQSKAKVKNQNKTNSNYIFIV
jgi:hypothetical protein